MKNWTLKEAVAVINAGTDTEAIKEIVKHFPLVAVIVARKDFDALAAAMPENLTVRKVENELNSGVTETTETTEADDVEEATEEADTEDLASMSTKQLIALCGKRGIKVPKYGKSKQFYLDALVGGAEEVEEAEEEATEEEDPVALYKQCKKAGLSVQPKKSAKYYKDALAKAAAEAEEAEEEEDWDDEEEEEAPAPKPAKKAPAKKEKAAKPAKKAPAKKAKEEVEEDVEEEDDDDDWDI